MTSVLVTIVQFTSTIYQVETYYENNESVGNDKDSESVGLYI